MDICSVDFDNLIFLINPTYAACIIGTDDEEKCFLAAVARSVSILSIVIAEKQHSRRRNLDFNKYGFIQTHRIKVNIAGSGKIRHVLVAKKLSVK